MEFLFTKLQLPPQPLTRGLPLPDPCPPSTESVETSPEKNSWVRHCVEILMFKTHDCKSPRLQYIDVDQL